MLIMQYVLPDGNHRDHDLMSNVAKIYVSSYYKANEKVKKRFITLLIIIMLINVYHELHDKFHLIIVHEKNCALTVRRLL